MRRRLRWRSVRSAMRSAPNVVVAIGVILSFASSWSAIDSSGAVIVAIDGRTSSGIGDGHFRARETNPNAVHRLLL